MEHLHTNDVISTIGEFIMENAKSLIVLITSLIAAHSPIHTFLHYNWSEWMPFLEVMKNIISTMAIIISSGLLILNYLKKRNNDRSEGI